MLLEFEIARITGWVEARIMPPGPAAAALRHLLSVYLQANGQRLDLRLFETFAHNRFEQYWARTCARPLTDVITSQAVRILYPPPGIKGQVVRLFDHNARPSRREMTVLEL